MTKDGVRDFIAAEYTLSENYVHGLAAFGPRLKNFESPHSSRGSSPGLPAGNSVISGRRRVTSAMMALFATDFAGFGWALMSRILDISVFWVVFVMERIVPCSKVLPPPDLGKSVCVSAGIQNITMSNIFKMFVIVINRVFGKRLSVCRSPLLFASRTRCPCF